MVDLVELAERARTCRACPLCEQRTQVVFGVGDPHARLMFIGEGPGREEDLRGEPFVGRSGQLLDRLIGEELAMTRTECYIANVVKCRPPNNRDPRPEEVGACSQFLNGQLEAIGPDVVIGLGNFAVRALLQVSEGVSRLRGRSYPFYGGTLVPTYHPAYVLRRGGGVELAQMRADFVRAKAHLSDAA